MSVIPVVSCLPLYVPKNFKCKLSLPSYSKLTSQRQPLAGPCGPCGGSCAVTSETGARGHGVGGASPFYFSKVHFRIEPAAISVENEQ